MMEKYLKDHYYDQITNVLNDTNDRTHASLNVDLSQLQQHHFDWFQAILYDVYKELPKWDAALLAAQKSIASEDEGFLETGYQIKVNCHVRFVHVPPPDPHFKLPFPNHDQIGQFREVKGTVVRMSQMKLLEIKREFVCSKCNTVVEIEADYSLMYRFDVPKNCAKAECKGNLHQKHVEPLPKYCVNYQELKIQEALSEKNIPPTLAVTLESDLVDSCQPGDCVTICGTIERRWTSFQSDRRCEAVITLRAVSLTREQNSLAVDSNGLSEQLMTLRADWIEYLNKRGELGMRDLILKSICPDVHGLYPVKLAIALSICSGNEISDNRMGDGLHQRGQSHILLVGDPGLAKSKLLLSAVQIAPRAVHTTGMGCSTAGLTAAAIKEDGEWVLEAGALVLADGGICCIDEFNLMRESDRASIHEAMEQQTISMAKAGIVCKLSTRCAILAAANPKNLHAMSEPEGTNAINIGIATPLLSRFDLVFILRDERIPEWDEAIADHLLSQVITGFQGFMTDENSELWSQQKLQSHFSAISQVQPKMTSIASAILASYYRRCRSDPERDQGRTTVRLLDSLNRLAEAHARLVFREEVTAIDAIVTIRLMESTFGFGRIVKPYDVIKEELPLGPDDDEIQCILEILDIDANHFNERKKHDIDLKTVKTIHTGKTLAESNQNRIERINLTQNSIPNENSQLSSINQQTNTVSVAATQSPKFKSFDSLKTSQSSIVCKQTVSNIELRPATDIDEEELDEILSFDIGSKKVETAKSPEKMKSQNKVKSQEKEQTVKQISTKENSVTGNAMSDDEDSALSQILEDFEQSQALIREPPPKMPKIDNNQENRSNRFALKLSRFAFVPLKRPNKENSIPTTNITKMNEKQPEIREPTQASNESVRNRILCTPSDDESTQPDSSNKLSAKRSLQLSFFRKPGLVGQRSTLQSQNVVNIPVVNAKCGNSQSENDSAYDTMHFSVKSSVATPSNVLGSAAKTGKTPPIYPTSESQNVKDDEQDLSYLDTLDFTDGDF